MVDPFIRIFRVGVILVVAVVLAIVAAIALADPSGLFSHTVILENKTGSKAGNAVSIGRSGGKSYLLTAAHVHDETTRLYTNGKPRFDLVAIDDLVDIAVVRVKSNIPSTTLGDPPRIGEAVVIISAFKDVKRFMVRGHAAAKWKDGTWLITAGALFPGQSGSGVYALRGGEWRLVCLLNQMLTHNVGLNFSHVGWCVPSDVLREFLAPLKIR